MAYGNQKAAYTPNNKAAPSGGHRSAPAATTTQKREAIFSTGLFAPDKEGVKSIGNVQVKETVTIPAGSYINLYAVDERKGDTSPVYRLQVMPGKPKA